MLPTVNWSQRPETLLMKVEVPVGVKGADGLTCDENSLVWKEGNVNLHLEFHAALDTTSIRIIRDE